MTFVLCSFASPRMVFLIPDFEDVCPSSNRPLGWLWGAAALPVAVPAPPLLTSPVLTQKDPVRMLQLPGSFPPTKLPYPVCGPRVE